MPVLPLEPLQQRRFARVVSAQRLHALVKCGTRAVFFSQLTKVLQNRNSCIVIFRPFRDDELVGFGPDIGLSAADSKCLLRCSACSCSRLLRSRSAASRFVLCRSFIIASARARSCAVVRRRAELTFAGCLACISEKEGWRSAASGSEISSSIIRARRES